MGGLWRPHLHQRFYVSYLFTFRLFIPNSCGMLQISLDIVQDACWSSNPQFVDFKAESTNQQSSATLKHNIRVTGLEEELFFSVHTTKKSSVYFYLSPMLFIVYFLFP